MKRMFAFLLAVTFSVPLLAQTVSPALFNRLEWRNIGPFRAGRTVAMAGAGGSSPIFYIGAVDGGVWRTEDAGMVWKPVFDREPVQSIGALDVSETDPNLVWVGTGESDIRSDLSSGDGVYKTTDGGKTWQNMGLHNTRQISRVVIDPEDNNIVYVAALGYAYGDSPDRGVYKTTDGGATWAKVLYKGDSIGAADLALAPGNPNILFACMWDAHRAPWSQYGPTPGPGSGLYRSTDGGQTWAELQGHGLPEGNWGRSGVAVSNDGKRIYALITARRSGLYVSDDGGDTWVLRNADPRLTGRDWYFSRITIDPNDPDTFYIPNTAVWRSTDAGKTFTIVRAAPGGDDYHQLWIDPKNSSRMILGSDHGATISIDKGATWTSWYNQPTGQIYHVVTDDQFPYVVYGSQQDDGALGIVSRTDHESITARDWFIAGQPESGYIALDPLHPGIRYVSSSYGGGVRVNGKESLSTEINPWPAPNSGADISQRKYRATWTPVLVMSPADKHSLYLGTQYILKTTDGGDHWTQISPDLTGAKKEDMKKLPMPAGAGGFGMESSIASDNPDAPTVANSIARGYGTIFTIAPSPRDAGIIWSGSDTGLVYLTRDDGKSWTNVTPPAVQPWSKISLIEASRFDSGTAYIAVDRHRLDDRTPYAYRTHDYGKTWTRITNGIADPDFIRVVREDSKRKDLLYAGTDFGIFVSFNDGDLWQPLQMNLPSVSVRDIDVHGDDLVIATHGRAFWIMDDITPLRQVAEAQAKDSPYFYQPETAIRVDHDPFPSTRIPVDEPTAKNPPEGAIVDYYLPSTAQKVSLKIYDVKGRLVREFSSDKATPPAPERAPTVADVWRFHAAPLSGEPGMHRFVWGLTWSSTGEMDPDFPDAGSASVAAPRLPKVAPGQYKLVLDVDGTDLTRMLTVVMDPRCTATQLALNRQQELGVSIYNDFRKAQVAIDQIRAASGGGAGGRRRGARQSGRDQSSAPPNPAAKILQGNGSDDDMGLTQIESALVSDMATVRSGYNAPTAQDYALYQQLHAALVKRLAEWTAMSQKPANPSM